MVVGAKPACLCNDKQGAYDLCTNCIVAVFKNIYSQENMNKQDRSKLKGSIITLPTHILLFIHVAVLSIHCRQDLSFTLSLWTYNLTFREHTRSESSFSTDSTTSLHMSCQVGPFVTDCLCLPALQVTENFNCLLQHLFLLSFFCCAV